MVVLLGVPKVSQTGMLWVDRKAVCLVPWSVFLTDRWLGGRWVAVKVDQTAVWKACTKACHSA